MEKPKRLPGRPRRLSGIADRYLRVRLVGDELERYQAKAAIKGLRLSEWARQVLNRAARRR